MEIQSKSCGCNKSITKLSEQEVNAALVNYGLEHEDNKPMPNELAKKLGIGKSTMNSYIKRYELYDKFNHGSSTAENEIYELLSKYCDVKPHDRSILKPLEIDVFLLEHNIGIEFDGNFWHDENHKKAGYHQEKTINANKKGIRLVHIFEYEWIENREMIEKFLIDLVSKKCAYHARNLELREITAHDANEFYKENHIQGGTRSSTINIGLYTNTNVLVAALSLGSPRFDTSSHYEIIRYCVKYGVAISGAFNKMLKYFEDKYNPKSVLTYSDASKFTADVYRNAGFNDLGITQPGYRWVKQNWPSLSRYQTQKHKLVADGLGREDQTENEIMAGLGYTKIYDCGNYKLIKNY